MDEIYSVVKRCDIEREVLSYLKKYSPKIKQHAFENLPEARLVKLAYFLYSGSINYDGNIPKLFSGRDIRSTFEKRTHAMRLLNKAAKTKIFKNQIEISRPLAEALFAYIKEKKSVQD